VDIPVRKISPEKSEKRFLFFFCGSIRVIVMVIYNNYCVDDAFYSQSGRKRLGLNDKSRV
jgi:hypothetical protein